MREINFKEIGWKFRVTEDMWRKLCLIWQDQVCGINIFGCPLCEKSCCEECPAGGIETIKKHGRIPCIDLLYDYYHLVFSPRQYSKTIFRAAILDVLINAKKVR